MEPSGTTKPLKCDKLTSWVHGEYIYVFGGFGSDKDEGISGFDVVLEQVHFQAPRGWNNQLFRYT